jgi:hypothetical protein
MHESLGKRALPIAASDGIGNTADFASGTSIKREESADAAKDR